jgi:heat shock protein HslJ
MTQAFFAVTLFALIASTAACQSAVPGTGLAGREFLSVMITENGAPKPLADGTRVRLQFEDSNLVAAAGCNTMSGTYRVQDGRLRFENGGMTAMGCPRDLQAQDTWLSTFLASNPIVRLSGSDLTLDGGATVVALVDREVAEPDANLVGPVWTLESIIAGDAVSSVPGDVRATLVFKDDGTVDVFAGCNRGSGTWVAKGNGIELGPIGLTKMACAGPGAQVEGAVVAVLATGTVGATIDASVLTLRAGNQGLAYRAAPQGPLTN